VDEQRFGHHLACGAQVCHGIGDVGRVPVDDRGDDQVQPRCPVLLRLGAAVCDPTLLEGADDLREEMTLFGLVQAGVAASTQCQAFQPVEREQGAFDPPQFLERQVELVLSVVGCKAS
jgi:hypothetical protein